MSSFKPKSSKLGRSPEKSITSPQSYQNMEQKSLIQQFSPNQYNTQSQAKLSEQEYLNLKTNQILHCDFSHFPDKISELIDHMLNYDQNVEEKKVEFKCEIEILQSGTANFSINEINNFKTIIHICLQLKAASDSQLKYYLSDHLCNEVSKNEELRISNQKLQRAFNEKDQELSNFYIPIDHISNTKIQNEFLEQMSKKLQQEISQKVHEIELLKSSQQEKENEFQVQFQKQATEFKQQERKTAENFTNQIDKFREEIKECQCSVSDLQKNEQGLKEKVYNLQNQLNDKQNQIISLIDSNKDLQSQNQELDHIRKIQIQKLEEIDIEMEGQIQLVQEKQNLYEESLKSQKLLEKEKNKLEKQNEEQKQSKKKQSQELENLNKQVNVLSQEKKQMEEKITNKKNKIKRLQEQVQVTEKEKENLETQNNTKENEIKDFIEYLNEKLSKENKYSSFKPGTTLTSINNQFARTDTSFNQQSYTPVYSDIQYTKQYKGYDKLTKPLESRTCYNEMFYPKQHKRGFSASSGFVESQTSLTKKQRENNSYYTTTGKVKYRRPDVPTQETN